MENWIPHLTVGSCIEMRYSKQDLTGEILAFNQSKGFLIVKGPSSDGKSKAYDVHIIHLDSIEYIINITPRKGPIPKPPSVDDIDQSKLDKRRRIELLNRFSSRSEVPITPEGLQLFMTLTRNFKTNEENDVKWDNANIVVMKNVIIEPPYHAEHVSGDDVAKNYVKKIVDKFWLEKN